MFDEFLHRGREIERLKGEITQIERQRNQSWSAAEQLKQTIAKLQSHYATANDLINNLRAQMAASSRQHDEHVQQLHNERRRLEQNHGSEIANLLQDFTDKENQLHLKHNATVADLAQHYENRESNLVTGYTLQISKLQQELSTHSEALIARDHDLWKASQFTTADLKKDPDEYIVGYFTEVKQMVDTLSRLKWKDSQAVWTEQTMNRLSRDCGLRMLRNNILKDHIWNLLHTFVFCSPFRIFGAEGRTLEGQWNEQYGEDPHTDNGEFVWPAREVETERWRYITVRECRLALVERLPSEYDPRTKVRKGFKKQTNALVQELRSSLMEVAHVEDSDVSVIERLTKRMAIVWLDCAMHRCRILMILQAPSLVTMSERAAQAETGSLVLNVMPRLKRYGDVRGFDLDKSAIIGKLEGEIMQLSWSRHLESQ